MEKENGSGYKRTKLGLIPEDWEYIPLRKVAQQPFINGIFKPPNEHGFGTLLINVIDTYKRIIVDIDQLNRVYTTSDELIKYKNRYGDLFFVRSSLKLEGVGNCCVLLNDEIPSIFECHLIRYRPDLSKVDPLFAAYLCRSQNIRKQLLSFAQTTTMSTIPQGYLEGCMLPFPHLPEQKKIATILSTWDEAIKLIRRLIDAKKQSRKALMQQLLTGKKRLKEDNGDKWRIRTIGELVKPISRPIPKPKDQYLSIGIRSHGKGTFHKIVNRPEKVMMDMLYYIEPRDLIVNITFAWEGAIAIATEEDGGGLVSHRFPTYRFKEKEADIDFFRNLMLTKRFIWSLGLISPGGAGRNRVLNQKDFLKLKFFIPGIKTQREIGKILSASDKEIILLEDYLNILEKQKRGLMQKLLTGEIRVKT